MERQQSWDLVGNACGHSCGKFPVLWWPIYRQAPYAGLGLETACFSALVLDTCLALPSTPAPPQTQTYFLLRDSGLPGPTQSGLVKHGSSRNFTPWDGLVKHFQNSIASHQCYHRSKLASSPSWMAITTFGPISLKSTVPCLFSTSSQNGHIKDSCSSALILQSLPFPLRVKDRALTSDLEGSTLSAHGSSSHSAPP